MTFPFELNNLRWRIQRDTRVLRLYVVEPHFYAPDGHAAILFAAVSRLKGETAEIYGDKVDNLPPPPFDLIVFPEVFLTSADLNILVCSLKNAGPTGCIHTGLRPDASDQFLFSTQQALELVQALLDQGACAADLETFKRWLLIQTEFCYFNLGVVLAVDIEGLVRVAIHTKALRSKFEVSTSAKAHMTEAKFLTVITLIPSTPALLPIVLQPLLCSDALIHATDYPDARPIDAISRCGHDMVPDHIDIVSLAACSPHSNPSVRFMWHSEFRDGFLRLAKDDANFRHRHAVVVVANFAQIVEGTSLGGLSGAFLPIPLNFTKQPTYVVAPQYVIAEKGDDPIWRVMEGESYKCMAHMISLRPPELKGDLVATMLGFDLHRVLRETNQFNVANGLSNYTRLVGRVQPDGFVTFSKDQS